MIKSIKTNFWQPILEMNATKKWTKKNQKFARRDFGK